MDFWLTTWSNVLGGIGAGLFFVLLYVILQWFLQATDLTVSYNWMFKTENGTFYIWPNLEIRNRSRSKTYRLANIAYTQNGQPQWFDNASVWGFVLEPGSINNSFNVAPIKNVNSLEDALKLEVTVRLQTGRAFWLRGQGPGQMGKRRLQRMLFALRAKLESSLVAME
ncbi:MAG: hypothetical protein WB424_18050 [Terracidiphilus sp.]